MCKWGNNNVMVANCDPKDIGRLSGQFDIVVADVPCSGEGMFRKEPKSINEWSAESVQLCAARSRRIISDVWRSLKEGGYLLYSTCTFNHYENDVNIEWICNTLGAESVKCEKPIEAIETKYGIQFAPGHTRGEGFFCALIKKCSSSPSLRSPKPNRTKFIKSPLVKDGNLLLMKGDLLKAYPEHHINKIGIIEENIRIIRSGIAVASIKGKDTIPDHALAMSSILSEGQYPTIELSLEDALNYLRREPIKIDYQTKGYILVRYKNIALGFIKNLGNRCNNLYPQQYRLRM
jgi:NOL1/NOP2/fmu family ribosome biogenesis protein